MLWYRRDVVVGLKAPIWAPTASREIRLPFSLAQALLVLVRESRLLSKSIPRDFSLELKVDGREVTADEYLEHCLILKKEDGSEEEDGNAARYNKPRRCIRKYFTNRKCFPFDRPGGRRILAKLEEVEDSDLSEDFVEETQIFCEHVFDEGPVKKLESGKALNGRMWAKMAETYVTAIGDGAVPCIENAVDAMAQIENARAMEEGVQLYRELFQKDVIFPTPDSETLSDVHSKALSSAIKHFMDKVFCDKSQEFQKRMNEQIDEVYQEFIRANEKATRSKCRELLEELEQDLLKKNDQGGYSKPGGYGEYNSDVKEVQKKYRLAEGLGIQAIANEELLDYNQKKMREGESIMAADKMITQKKQEAEAERYKVLAAEKAQEMAERARDKGEQYQREQEQAHKENIDQFEEKKKQEMEELRIHQDKVLEGRMSEQMRLQREGFQEQSTMMIELIRSMRPRTPPPSPSHPCTIQ